MQFEIKQGEDLVIDFTRRDAAGVPVDISGDTITSKVAMRDFSGDLTTAKVNAAAGQGRLTASAAETATWPAATLEADVKFDGGAGQVRKSKTFRIKVTKGPTP
ncbi:hypothetical protein LX70_02684 [Defluviimonas denitrificans]|jgi:hypothetical protein|uniref:BppU N-terminal domain-containing protein n=1 Tax=Albidovulum denitrificans TaxID=404881 RepID=A0A2S8S6P8_9RHOB|nr:hypothetical protein [Defluviimonas denitrificans]PQV56418.1 hypothetical protein LX70_02684 [Defluviimonas denitrificans]